MVRKISLTLVIVVGAFWVAGALAADYPKKTQAVDNLTNSFRPDFTDSALAQSAADLRTSKTFADDFRTKAAPALAQQLNVTPDQFVAFIAQQYPAVGKGLTQLPQILDYFTSVQTTMAAQQHNFHQADAIPTKSLPNTTVTWLFVLPGIVAMVLGATGFFFWRPVIPALAALLGLGVILTTLVISTPAKTRAADRLNDAFRPIFTTQSATQPEHVARCAGQDEYGGGNRELPLDVRGRQVLGREGVAQLEVVDVAVHRGNQGVDASQDGRQLLQSGSDRREVGR